MQSNLNYDLSYYHTISHQNVYDDLIWFRKNLSHNCFSTTLQLSVSESLHGILAIIADGLRNVSNNEPKIVCYDPRTAAIIVPSAFFVIEDQNASNSNLWAKYDRSITINAHGDGEIIQQACEYLSTNIEQRKVPIVSWEFLAGDDRRSQDIKIKQAKPIFPEFYPWIGDVNTYFDRYLASEASILVLLGETGTAKTSFIRSMIWHASLNTMFTYEEELLSSDSMFVDFIVDEKYNLLVIEDADLFLTSREHDGNKIMSKFLNISDGLANIDQKKIIFTANITETNRIDNALLRAGRCFDCMTFRRLTYQEACAAATAAGIAAPQRQSSYTLAELFAEAKGENRQRNVRGVGF